jgi:uncharacterized phage protein gp47/JayE
MADYTGSNYIPQVDYTSRDYQSIREDLYNLIPIFAPQWTSRDPADLGIAILEIFAHMADALNYYVDRSANEAFITTATQRESVLKIAAMLGYTPTDISPAAVTLNFSNSTSAAIFVPAQTQVASTIIVNGSSTQVIFETDLDITVPAKIGASVGNLSVTATEGETIYDEEVGASTGKASQLFVLSQHPVIQDSIAVVVNGTTYSKVSYLLESSGTAPVFSSRTNSEGVTFISFGDGVGGRIPPANATIYVTYRIGSGKAGNVSAGVLTSIISNYTSGLSVTNGFSAIGGSDIESTDSIRVNAPLGTRAGGQPSLSRAVSLSDYASLAVQVSGVAKAYAKADVFTNVNLYIAPFGDTGLNSDGTLSTVFNNLANNIANYFVNKIPPGVSISILPPTFVGVNLSVQIYAQSQYKQSVVQVAVEKALSELLSFDNVTFSDHISLHNIMATLAGVPGVDYSVVTQLVRADSVIQTGVNDCVFTYNEIPQIGTTTVVVTNGIAG